MNAVHLLHKRLKLSGIKSFFIILLQFWSLLLISQDSIPCLMPWIPPLYAVSETHWDVPNSFWQNGGFVPENLVNEDTTDYGRAHVMLTGSASVRVFADDSTATFDEGTYAGFFIKSPVFRDSLFDGVTISTYLNGVLEETFTGNDLNIDHIPEYVNEPVHIGFISTRIFNQVELTLDGAGGNVNYDVFFAVIRDCNPPEPNLLPVTWLSFEARQNNKIVDLEWMNTQEFNNAGFEVERSGDGLYFECIGKVSSGRNPDDINVYSFTDEAPFKNVNYYRIKQIDHDGKVSYSNIRSVLFQDKNADIMLWPNPAAENLIVDFGTHEEGGIIQIVSSTGMMVLNKSFTSIDQRLSLDISSLGVGLYEVVIKSPNAEIVNRLVVIR
jgi:hypothetical protein